MDEKINLAIIGINGRMAKDIILHLVHFEKYNIIAGIEREESILVGKKFSEIDAFHKIRKLLNINIFSKLKDINEAIDIVIDFSTPKSTLFHLESFKNKKVAFIIGTTGFSSKDFNEIKKFAKNKPIIYSENYSIGINVINLLIENALKTKMLEDFDIEVLESHHRDKIDSPSGTAKMILENIKKTKNLSNRDIVYHRHGKNIRRKKNQMGVSSIRGGSIIGEHEVRLLGDHENIILKHSANNRLAYSQGVSKAIDFAKEKLDNQKFGLFSFQDIISN